MVHFMDPRKTGTDFLYSWGQVCGFSFVSQLKSLQYLQNPHQKNGKERPTIMVTSLSLLISLIHPRKGNFVQNLTSTPTLRQLLGERAHLLRSICSLPNPASWLPEREIFFHFSPHITNFCIAVTLSSIKYSLFFSEWRRQEIFAWDVHYLKWFL